MSPPLPPLNALRAFDAVARRRNITRAAEELRVSRSAVSQHLRNLEDCLGRTLFVRRGNALDLTDDGADYAAAIGRAFDDIAAATATLRETAFSTSITLAAPPSFATCWLIPKLPAFRAANPTIDVSLDINAKIVKRDDEQAGAARPDLAIRYSAKRNAAVEPLIEPSIVPVASARYLNAVGKVQSHDDLGRHRLIDYAPADAAHMSLHFRWSDASRSAEPEAEYPEAHLALAAALRGEGVALLEDVLVSEALEDGLLHFAWDARFTAKGRYVFVAAHPPKESAAIDALKRWIRSETRRARQRSADR